MERLLSVFSRNKEAGPVVANLGTSNQMYYNKELRRWVEPGQEEAARKEMENSKAPPPKAASRRPAFPDKKSEGESQPPKSAADLLCRPPNYSIAGNRSRSMIGTNARRPPPIFAGYGDPSAPLGDVGVADSRMSLSKSHTIESLDSYKKCCDSRVREKPPSRSKIVEACQFVENADFEPSEQIEEEKECRRTTGSQQTLLKDQPRHSESNYSAAPVERQRTDEYQHVEFQATIPNSEANVTSINTLVATSMQQGVTKASWSEQQPANSANDVHNWMHVDEPQTSIHQSKNMRMKTDTSVEGKGLSVLQPPSHQPDTEKVSGHSPSNLHRPVLIQPPATRMDSTTLGILAEGSEHVQLPFQTVKSQIDAMVHILDLDESVGAIDQPDLSIKGESVGANQQNNDSPVAGEVIREKSYGRLPSEDSTSASDNQLVTNLLEKIDDMNETLEPMFQEISGALDMVAGDSAKIANDQAAVEQIADQNCQKSDDSLSVEARLSAVIELIEQQNNQMIDVQSDVNLLADEGTCNDDLEFKNELQIREEMAEFMEKVSHPAQLLILVVDHFESSQKKLFVSLNRESVQKQQICEIEAAVKDLQAELEHVSGEVIDTKAILHQKENSVAELKAMTLHNDNQWIYALQSRIGTLKAMYDAKLEEMTKECLRRQTEAEGMIAREREWLDDMVKDYERKQAMVEQSNNILHQSLYQKQVLLDSIDAQYTSEMRKLLEENKSLYDLNSDLQSKYHAASQMAASKEAALLQQIRKSEAAGLSHEQKMRSSQSLIKDLQSANETLEVANQDLKIANDNLQWDLERSMSVIKEKEVAMVKVQKEAERKLLEAAERHGQSAAALETANVHLEEQLHAVGAKLSEAAYSIEQLRAEGNSLAVDSQSKSQELKAAKAAASLLESANNNLSQLVIDLRQELDESQRQSDKYQQLLVEQEAGALKAIQEVEARGVQEMQQKDNLIASVELSCAQVQEQLADSQREVDNLQQVQLMQEDARLNLLEQVERLRREKAQVEQRFYAVESSNKHLEKQVVELTQQHESLQNNLENGDKTAALQRQQIGQKERIVETLEAANADLQRQLDESKEKIREIESLLQSREDTSECMASLTISLEQAEKDKQALLEQAEKEKQALLEQSEEEKKILQAKLQDLTAQLKQSELDSQAQLNQALERLSRQDSESSDISQSDNAALQQLRATLAEETYLRSTERGILEERNQKLSDELKEIKMEMKALQDRMQSHNVSDKPSSTDTASQEIRQYKQELEVMGQKQRDANFLLNNISLKWNQIIKEYPQVAQRIDAMVPLLLNSS